MGARGRSANALASSRGREHKKRDISKEREKERRRTKRVGSNRAGGTGEDLLSQAGRNSRDMLTGKSQSEE